MNVEPLKWKKWANATPQDDDIEMGKRKYETLEHIRNNHQERGTHETRRNFSWKQVYDYRTRNWFASCLRGRSQLSTFMKAYTAYARGEGVWDHRTLSPRKSTFIFNHWQCIIKYCTCLECGQYAHICRSFMYSNNFEGLFLTSKCTKGGFLWTQTVAPHRH